MYSSDREVSRWASRDQEPVGSEVWISLYSTRRSGLDDERDMRPCSGKQLWGGLQGCQPGKHRGKSGNRHVDFEDFAQKGQFLDANLGGTPVGNVGAGALDQGGADGEVEHGDRLDDVTEERGEFVLRDFSALY